MSSISSTGNRRRACWTTCAIAGFGMLLSSCAGQPGLVTVTVVLDNEAKASKAAVALVEPLPPPGMIWEMRRPEIITKNWDAVTPDRTVDPDMGGPWHGMRCMTTKDADSNRGEIVECRVDVVRYSTIRLKPSTDKTDVKTLYDMTWDTCPDTDARALGTVCAFRVEQKTNLTLRIKKKDWPAAN